MLQLPTEKLQHTQQRMNRTRLSLVRFTEKIDPNRITMESLSTELVSYATAQLFPDKTLSSFTIFFYPNKWIWKVNGSLQIRKHPTHQCTKMSQREGFCFMIKKLHFRLNFTVWNPVSNLPLRILLKPWTIWFNKDTITAKAVSQLKCLGERKKLRFIFPMNDLAVHSLLWNWDTFSVAMLALIFEWCWGEKDLSNQILLTILSAYTLSWQTRTWLSTSSLGTRKLHCCVAFFSFETSKMETL